MLSREESGSIVRLQVVGPDGGRIGAVEAMYVDEETREREFALVGLGPFRSLYAYVPMAGSRTEGERVRVPYSKDTVVSAPTLEPTERLDESELSALYRHYGLAARPRETAAAPSGSRGHPGDEQADEGLPLRADMRGAREDTVARGATPTDDRPEHPRAPVARDFEPPGSPVSEPGEEAVATGRGDVARGGASAGAEPGPSLGDRTVDELRQLAAERDLAGRSSMKKQELLDALGGGGQPGSGVRSRGDYENRTVDELRRLAADRDIAGRSSMNKEQLIEALRAL